MDLNFKIVFTPLARQNIHEISEYIAHSLGEPNLANKWANDIFKSTAILENMPELYAVFDIEPCKSKQVRRYPVKNYVVYYRADMQNKIVYIIKVCYAAQDLKNQIKGI